MSYSDFSEFISQSKIALRLCAKVFLGLTFFISFFLLTILIGLFFIFMCIILAVGASFEQVLAAAKHLGSIADIYIVVFCPMSLFGFWDVNFY